MVTTQGPLVCGTEGVQRDHIHCGHNTRSIGLWDTGHSETTYIVVTTQGPLVCGTRGIQRPQTLWSQHKVHWSVGHGAFSETTYIVVTTQGSLVCETRGIQRDHINCGHNIRSVGLWDRRHSERPHTLWSQHKVH